MAIWISCLSPVALRPSPSLRLPPPREFSSSPAARKVPPGSSHSTTSQGLISSLACARFPPLSRLRSKLSSSPEAVSKSAGASPKTSRSPDKDDPSRSAFLSAACQFFRSDATRSSSTSSHAIAQSLVLASASPHTSSASRTASSILPSMYCLSSLCLICETSMSSSLAALSAEGPLCTTRLPCLCSPTEGAFRVHTPFARDKDHAAFILQLATPKEKNQNRSLPPSFSLCSRAH
mmetsp:Transcript_7047/g.18178  ORF Transcript_7047/g.18178 Transcript_7047/m.18178 type:complete len:235 (+) Transcript_7047:170-874(+)